MESREDSLDGFGVGDEELEEGIVVGGVEDEGGGVREGQGRLSRELEGGFMDDSSDDNDDERPRRQRR